MVLSAILGAIIGVAFAYVGATRIFTCREPAFEAVCAGGPPILALAWGVSVGLVGGLIAGLALSRRANPH
jgi:hypothetical protein